MKRLLIVTVLTLLCNIIVNGQNVTQRIYSGTSDPITCQPTDRNVFYRSDSGTLKVCTAANTWTAIGAAAGTITGSGSSGQVSIFTGASTIGGDTDLTFTADTLTVTKAVASTSLVINGGTALTTTNRTGTGNLVLATSPTLTTPVLGVATATSINSLTITTSTGTLTIPNGTTLNAGVGGTLGSNAFTSTSFAPIASPTFTGTVALPTSISVNSNIQTFPTSAATLARTDAGQTFTGSSTFTSALNAASVQLTSVDQYFSGNSGNWRYVPRASDNTTQFITNSITGFVITTDGHLVVGGGGNWSTLSSVGDVTVDSVSVGYRSANNARSATIELIALNTSDQVEVASGGGATVVGGNLLLQKTITAGGTTGAQTINKTSGSVNFAATATSLVVTNSLVATSSVINCTVATNDTTFKSAQCVAASGSFTVFANAAATAETRVNFSVTN